MWQSCSESPAVAYSAEEAAAMDVWLVERGFTVPQLMGAAGARLADAARECCADWGLSRVVCLVGPGNNGGDALVAAERLRERDASPGDATDRASAARDGSSPGAVPPAQGGARRPGDPTDVALRRPLAGDAADVALWRPLAGDPTPALDAHTLLVDGLFGVGLARPIEGAAREAVQAVSASPARVLAVDVPSGLHATTGQVQGVAVRADRTLSFVGPKQGFFVGRGPEHVGAWRAASIGFPPHEAEAWVRARRVATATDA